MLGGLLGALLAGPLITLVVGFFKRVPWVQEHPKTAATLLAAGATAVSVIPGVGGPLASVMGQLSTSIGAVAAAAVTAGATTAIAVGTHEVAGNAIRAAGIDPTVATTSTPSKNPLTN